jgi:TonB-dependent SusC/RagA subfamily outer membrane receptor
MTTLSARTALPVLMLAGLASACASGHSSAVAPPPAPPTVTSTDVDHNPGTSIEKLLEAKVPGVSVVRTADGGIAIEIRGMGSSLSGNSPLYVIDDAPVEAGPHGALMGLNPYDIETIKVLKNPADIAIYGLRGANGVILITTKRPSRPEEQS